MKSKRAVLLAAMALMLTASAGALIGCERESEPVWIEAQTVVPTVFRCTNGDGAEIFAGYSDGGWDVQEIGTVSVSLDFELPTGEAASYAVTVPVLGEKGAYKIVADRAAPAYIALPDYREDGIYDLALTVGGGSPNGEFRYEGSEKPVCAGSLICIPIACGSVYDVLLYDVNTGALSDLSGGSYASADEYVTSRLIPEVSAVPWTVPEGESAAEYYLRYGATSSSLYRDYYRILAYAPMPSVDGRWIFYLASDGEGAYSCDYMAYDTATGQSMLLSKDSFGAESLSSHAEESFACLPSGEAVIVPWMQSAYDAPRPVTLARFDGVRWSTESIDRAAYEKDGAILAYGFLITQTEEGATLRRISDGTGIFIPKTEFMTADAFIENSISAGPGGDLCFAGWDEFPALEAIDKLSVPNADTGVYEDFDLGDDVFIGKMYICGSDLLVNVREMVGGFRQIEIFELPRIP